MKQVGKFVKASALDINFIYQNPHPSIFHFAELRYNIIKQDGIVSNTLYRGDVVRIKDGKFVNCYKPYMATHMVINCYIINNRFYTIELCPINGDIIDNKIANIKINIEIS
jgi:hypothetical protein